MGVMLILKTIGLGILYLLFLLFVIILLIIFSPVKYRGIYEINNKDLDIDAKATWLFRFITVSYVKNPSGNLLVVKLCGITLGKNKKRSLFKKKQKSIKHRESKPDFQTDYEEGKNHEKEGENENSPHQAHNQIQEDPETDKSTKNIGSGEDGEPQNKKEKITEKAARILQTVQYAIEKGKELYTYEDKDQIIKLTIKLVKELFKKNKPKNFFLKGELGFKEPDTTGYVIGLCGIIKTLFPLTIYIKGNFEKSIIAISGELSGKVSVFTLFRPLLKYILSKPIWKIVKKVVFNKKDYMNERNESHVR